MTGATLLAAQVLHVAVTLYLLGVFAVCVMQIRRDAQSASNAREHPKGTRIRTKAESASETM